MKTKRDIADASSLELAKRLKSRMMPLAVLVTVTISISAPVVFLAFGLHEVRDHATTTAHRIGRLIEREVYEDELLWKYNVPKLLGHLRAYGEDPNVSGIEVVDADGRRVEISKDTNPSGSVGTAGLWAASEIGVEGRELGRVWVAFSTRRVYRDALLVFGLFALVGLAFGWLVYTLPTTAASRAEEMIVALVDRLRQSREELATVNEGLERRVSERSEQLSEAYRELKAKEARLREVSGQAILLQERERRAIARELHDAVGQALTAVRINLQLIEEGRDKRGETSRIAEKTVGLVDEALEEVRRAVALLGPAILDEIGLQAAVETQCVDFAERTSVEVVHEIATIDEKLAPAVESTCYRVVQEGLTNVMRHASASRVDVSLAISGDKLSLEIRDDGRGMDPEAGSGSGQGLVGIRQRVYMLGGEVDVDSGPGRGTVVRVTLPVQLEERDAAEVAP